MNTLTLLYLFAVYLILPAVFIYSLWKGSFHSKLTWLIQLAATCLIILWLFFAGPWDWFSYYLRYLWVVLLLAAVQRSWRKAGSKPFIGETFGKQAWYSIIIHGVLIIVFGLYNGFVLSSFMIKEQAIELSFPLKDGAYYVGQGGNHVQMNYHQAYPPQKYALDIVKLNTIGARAAGFYPKDLDQYEIFGDPLYSPCDGKVLEARDGLPDLTPPDTDPEHPKGNYAALYCKGSDAVIFLAHLQEGSLTVEEGMSVQEGQLIGRVGNSGNTTEPHLHIHAELNGAGVPIRFNGRFLVRNNVVKQQ